jgi:hypothetical protein
MVDLEVAVDIVGHDQLSRAIDQATASLTRLNQTAEQGQRHLTGFWNTLERGVSLGVGIGVGFRAVDAALSAVAGAARGVGEAVFGSNSRLEQATVTFESFTRSAGAAQQIMDALRHEADITPFNTSEVVDAGKALIASAHGSRDALLGLVQTAEVLAALRPEQGLRGAAVALQEATAGQFESVIDRFNLSREAINRFAAQGKTGIEIVRAALVEMGADASLVERLGQTFEGRKSTIAAFFAEFERRLGEGVFTRVSEAMGRMVAFIARHGDELQATASRIGAVVGALFQRLAETVGGAAQRLLNALSPGLGDRIAQEWQATAAAVATIGPAAQGATPAAQALAHALTLPEARQALEAATSQVDKLKSLAAQIEPPIKQVDRALAGVGVQAAEVQLEASRVKNAYDDQVYPLERQLRLLQESGDLLEANARQASAHARAQLLLLDAQVAALAERVPAEEQNPDNPDLTPRQQLVALRLQELTAQRDGLRLEEGRRGAVLSLQERITAIRQAQADALHPLEQQLQALRDQADVLNLQRERWQLIKQDIDLATTAANALPKALPVPGADDAAVAARQAELRAQGETLADSLLGGFQDWIDKNGGSLGGALQSSLTTWYDATGKPFFDRLGENIGDAIVNGALKRLLAFWGSNPGTPPSPLDPRTAGGGLFPPSSGGNPLDTDPFRPHGGIDVIANPQPTHRQAGGDVWPGNPYLVGERGPELFLPRQSGYIVPASASSAASGAARAAGPVTITLHQTLNAEVHHEADEQRFAKLAAREAAAALDQFVQEALAQAPHPAASPTLAGSKR